MFRNLVTRTSVVLALALATLLAATVALAGPVIEFGDSGFLQIDLKGQVYVENTDFGAGRTLDESRTDIHFQRLRLAATGMLDETWGFKFQTCGNIGTTKNALGYGLTAQDVDWNDRDVRIIDSYIIANLKPALNLKVGLTKLPVTRANLDDCFAPLSLDRSMFDYNAYGTSPAKFSRDLGIVSIGDLVPGRLKYFAGAFQGREGQSAVINPLNGVTYRTTIEPKSSLLLTARMHYAFLDEEPGSGYQGTYFGDARILTIGGGIAHEGSIAYRNVTFDPGTGAVAITNDETVDYNAYAADLMFEYPLSAGVATFTAQYLKNDFDDAFKTNVNPGDHLAVLAGINGQKEGGYGKFGWMLPGTIGAEGRLQPYAVWENWKFARISGVTDQTIAQYGAGINYYVHRQGVRLTLEYLKTTFDKATPLAVGMGTVIGNMEDFATVRGMMQVVF